jgi:hypothetical protein
MAPVSVPAVRAALGPHTLAECRGTAALALDAVHGRASQAAARR